MKLCARWWAPDVVHSDNGSEFRSVIVQAIFPAFGVKVSTGAVRHPQSQGTEEWFNRTLFGLVRKTLDESADWKADLDILLHDYCVRPHSTTGISPMEATTGWMPCHFLIEDVQEACELSQYVT